jgi:hypothetical protein
MNRIATRFLAGAASALVVAAGPTDVEAQATFTACRVPDVGAIYMIGVAGAPSECLDASHVEFSWTEGAEVADASVTTEKLADGAVTSAKIGDGAVGSAAVEDGSLTAADLAPLAAGGMATANLGTASAIGTTPTDLGSISFEAPADGQVFVALSGHAVIFGDNTLVEVGLGSATGLLDLHSVRVGRLDGSGTERFDNAFNSMTVVGVSAGTNTFHATAQKPAVFSTNTVNLANLRLVLIFIPS